MSNTPNLPYIYRFPSTETPIHKKTVSLFPTKTTHKAGAYIL